VDGLGFKWKGYILHRFGRGTQHRPVCDSSVTSNGCQEERIHGRSRPPDSRVSTTSNPALFTIGSGLLLDLSLTPPSESSASWLGYFKRVARESNDEQGCPKAIESTAAYRCRAGRNLLTKHQAKSWECKTNHFGVEQIRQSPSGGVRNLVNFQQLSGRVLYDKNLGAAGST